MRQMFNACGQTRETSRKAGVTLEVTYLRLDPAQPETGVFDEYVSQQIIYSSINQYGADVIIPKTLPMKLNGITLSRNRFWSDNAPDLIVTTVQPSWSNGQPRISIKFDSDNLLTILKFCGEIYLQDGYRLTHRKNKVLLHQGLISSEYILSDTQEYTIKQLETINGILKDVRETVIDTYENQLIQAFKLKNTLWELKI